MAWVVLDESRSGIVKMTDASETWNVLGVSRYKRAIAQRPA
ncbi:MULTISPECIES: hypothetical protein [unclassified Coleofasciculus]|nr:MULTISPECIES: hypothetical protein [unclassified Coleofasciculus]